MNEGKNHKAGLRDTIFQLPCLGDGRPRKGRKPRGMANLVTALRFKPRSCHSPSSVLSCAVMEGAPSQAGCQRSLHGQFLLERTSSSGLDGWGEDRAQGIEEWSDSREGWAVASVLWAGGSWTVQHLGELLGNLAHQTGRSKKWGLSALRVLTTKEELCIPTQHSMPSAMLSHSHVLIHLVSVRILQGRFSYFIPWGNWGSELGKEWTKITQLRRMELALSVGHRTTLA